MPHELFLVLNYILFKFKEYLNEPLKNHYLLYGIIVSKNMDKRVKRTIFEEHLNYKGTCKLT